MTTVSSLPAPRFKKTLLLHYKDLILHKAYADFRAEAERTYLGVVWWVLEPLINMAIYYLVFGIFFGNRGEDFIPYLLTGLVIWRYFDTTVNRAASSILINMNLVRQTAFHKIIFPLISVCTCSFEFLFSLALLLTVYLFYGIWPTLFWLAFPLVFLVLVLLTLAIALPLAAMVPFVPDLLKPLQYGMRLAFYMSGVMYYMSSLSPRAQELLQWNPALHLIEAFRTILMYQDWPQWDKLLVVAGLSLVLVFLGAILNRMMDPIYAKRVSS